MKQSARKIYYGTFLIALATLGLEIALTRLLSVTTWYHLAFFAISTAMLGMTAGAVTVYLRPRSFAPERLDLAASAASVAFAASTAVSLILLCLIPMDLDNSVTSLLSLAVTTAVCALPFYFSGIAIAAVLTRSSLPIGKIYASDLAGASIGCLTVLAGMSLLDVPSLILVFAAIGAGAAFLFAGRDTTTPAGRRAGIALASLLILAAVNGIGYAGIAPRVVKGEVEDRSKHLLERWNSFSRVVVHKGGLSIPQLWGPGARMPDQAPVMQYYLNIDGDAGTTIRQFRTRDDIAHLAYDVTNVAYHLRQRGSACVIGVGGGRDIHSALLAGHRRILGLEVNPIFIDLLEGPFAEFAGLAANPQVELVADEARSYLSRTSETFSVIQMSLIDTWAATGAGAFSLSENALYTVDAWKLLLDRLDENGVLTVSRWHSPGNLGETGRVISLAVASLLESGVSDPARHIAMITSGKISTTIVARSPFTGGDVARLDEIATTLGFDVAISPSLPPKDAMLRGIVSVGSLDELRSAVADAPLNYAPPTDESPYFFNMLRLGRLREAFEASPGVVSGNLRATVTLIVLLICLAVFAVATIVLPLALRRRYRQGPAPRTLWSGAAYFSLIGAGFMLVEIALIQRISVFLGHPVYALGILLFTLIATAGIGSFLSERLPLTRGARPYLLPVVAAAIVVVGRYALPVVLARFLSAPTALKIVVTVLMLAPIGVLLGMFFPCGMRLARLASADATPWYWALNGIFGVLCSALAVFISIHLGISTNLFIGAACYALLLPCVRGMIRARTRIPSYHDTAQDVSAA